MAYDYTRRMAHSLNVGKRLQKGGYHCPYCTIQQYALYSIPMFTGYHNKAPWLTPLYLNNKYTLHDKNCMFCLPFQPIHYYTHPIWPNTRQREGKIEKSSPPKVKDTQTKKDHSTDEVKEDHPSSDIEEVSSSRSEPLETVNKINGR